MDSWIHSWIHGPILGTNTRIQWKGSDTGGLRSLRSLLSDRERRGEMALALALAQAQAQASAHTLSRTGDRLGLGDPWRVRVGVRVGGPATQRSGWWVMGAYG